MHVRMMSFALCLLALVAAALLVLGSCVQACSEAIREETFDAEEWVSANGPTAEAYARRLLAGEDGVPVPPSLARYQPRHLGETVAFAVIRGGFQGMDQGVCFAPSGQPPPESLGMRPRDSRGFRWERVEGPWWYWAAYFF